MSNEELLRMAKVCEINFRHTPANTTEMWCDKSGLLKFAALVQAATAEECAKVCDEHSAALDNAGNTYVRYPDSATCGILIRSKYQDKPNAQ